MRYLFISLFLWAIVSLYGADGEEVEIKGGFGYVLGEDGSKLKGSKINDDSIELQAKSSFRNFNKCRISINDDKQIYIISSIAHYDSEKETDREYKIILNLLEKKYKTKFTDITSQRRNDKDVTQDQVFFSLKQGSKNILLRKYSKAIRLYYWDTEMNNIQRERKKRSDEQKNNNNIDSI